MWLEDPYNRANGPVQLSGVFRNTTDLAVGPRGARARWLARVEDGGVFGRLPVPALLLCATARTLAYLPVAPGRLGVRVPGIFPQIDLYASASDAVLARRHPKGIRIFHETATGECTAVGHDDQVLLRLVRPDLPVLGTVPLRAW